MIHVVTLFGDQHKQDILEVECARQNIRFVREDFQSAEEFLEGFSAIDTTVDVVILGETRMETYEKSELFDTIRIAEPNIRIIILFPGYRNQYIEEQIREYKEVYGISDILYEGAGIDAAYFAEVMKKGFLYDCQVNAYDEPEETPPQPKENKCVKIGIIGLTHGCGVTNMAVAISNYVALSQDMPVKVVDFTETGSLRFAKGKKVTYLVHAGIDVERVCRTSGAVIFDFGAPFLLTPKGKLITTEPSFTLGRETCFKGCDLKICMGFSDPWHVGKVKYFWHEKRWKKEVDDSWIFLFDTLPEKLKTKYAVYARNDKEIEARIDRLLKEGSNGT